MASASRHAARGLSATNRIALQTPYTFAGTSETAMHVGTFGPRPPFPGALQCKQACELESGGPRVDDARRMIGQKKALLAHDETRCPHLRMSSHRGDERRLDVLGYWLRSPAGETVPSHAVAGIREEATWFLFQVMGFRT